MEENRHIAAMGAPEQAPAKAQAPQLIDRHQSEWVRRAGQVAGFLYFAGDIAFMTHASKANKGGLDKLKMTRGAAYLVGSLILLNCTNSKTDSPYQDSTKSKLRTQLDKDIEDAGISKHTSETIEHWIRRELKQHPWEVAHLLFLAGTGMQSISALSQKRWTEAAATLGTLTSIMIPIVVPEGDQKPFIKFSDNMEKQGHHFAESYHHIKQAMPVLKPIFNLNDIILHQIRQHPLRVSAGLAMISNSAYGLQALQKNPVEKGLAAMSATYVAANVATSFASKNMDVHKDWDAHADDLNEQMSDGKSVPHHPAHSF